MVMFALYVVGHARRCKIYDHDSEGNFFYESLWHDWELSPDTLSMNNRAVRYHIYFISLLHECIYSEYVIRSIFQMLRLLQNTKI